MNDAVFLVETFARTELVERGIIHTFYQKWRSISTREMRYRNQTFGVKALFGENVLFLLFCLPCRT